MQVQVLFPALVQYKDLRQFGVSPFSFAMTKSYVNLTQDWAYIGFTSTVETQTIVFTFFHSLGILMMIILIRSWSRSV